MDETEIPLRIEAAAKLNASLARRVIRWKRTRLVLFVISLVVAVGCFFLQSLMILSPPFFLAAFCFLMLYLAARDQLREVESRRWTSQTPWISKLNEARRIKLESRQQSSLPPSQ